MASSFPHRKAVLLLLTFLALPLAAAAEPRNWASQADSSASWNVFHDCWKLLSTLFSDEGYRIDPFGHCKERVTSEASTRQVEEGCMIDPYGRCADQNTKPESSEHVDAGCMVDPYGLCRDGQ